MTDTSRPSVPDHEGRFRLQRSERDWDRIAVLAIVLGTAVRILWILVVHPPWNYVYSDMMGYVVRAQRLASGAPLTPDDAFFPPGTHMLLSVPFGLFGNEAGLWTAALLWCLLSSATIYISWRLTRELLTPAAAALTAVLCAGWPLFISYGGYFTSETPALALLLAALWAGIAATRREGGTALTLALLAGVLGGAASAVRPQLLINIAILMLTVLFLVSRKRFATISCLVAGLAAVVALVVVHNSVATNQLTGLATNGGLNVWFGHCDARQVTTVDAENRVTARVVHPVASQAGRPGDYVVRNHGISDGDFFLGLGRECVEQEGIRHVLRLGRNVLDMTATTTPWPQSESGGWPQDVVQATNVLYSVLLAWIVIESLGLSFRRQRERKWSGQRFLLLNLACVALVAILVLGDPRVRTVYDVFGFALLGALLADRFHLDDPTASSAREVGA